MLAKKILKAKIIIIVALIAAVILGSLIENVLIGVAVAGTLGFLLGVATLSPIKKHFEEQRKSIKSAIHDARTPLAIIKTESEIGIMQGAKISHEEALAMFKNSTEATDKISDILSDLSNKVS